jgi:phosphoglycolate phosphatase
VTRRGPAVDPDAGPDGPLLVWDFDGTLADTFAAIRASATAALDAHGLGPLDEAALRASVGLALSEVLARLVPGADPALVTSLVAAYREAFPAAGAASARLFPGVAALLAELGDRGVTSAVATGRHRVSTEQLLDRFGIADRFATVHCESDLAPGRGKPQPDLVLRACAATGRDPADTVVLGDSPLDVAMGRAAGARTIAVTWGNASRPALAAAGPTHTVDDLAALRAVLVGAALR